MDNLQAHKNPSVLQRIHNAGCHALFLPLFDRWLAEKRREARIEWMWGTTAATQGVDEG